MSFLDHQLVIRVRKATEEDLPLLLELGRKTFYEAFREHNTKENMALFLEAQYQLPVLKAEMEEEGAAFFLACRGKETLGYAKVRTGHEPPNISGRRALEVERIYVLAEHQAARVGTLLMEHNLAYALSLGYDLLWLGVWEHNVHAIRLYERLGFSAFSSHTFSVGRDIQLDILMKKSI